MDDCPICGERTKSYFDHRCDPKFLARRDGQMQRDPEPKEVVLSVADRIGIGFKIMSLSEDRWDEPE